jgi:hypothetical protein
MTHRTFSLVTAVLFFLVALLHAVRLLRGWQVTVEGAVHTNLDQLDRARHRGVLGLSRFFIEQDADEIDSVHWTGGFNWRNISVTLIDTQKGEWKAQACVNAWLQQLPLPPSA